MIFLFFSGLFRGGGSSARDGIRAMLLMNSIGNDIAPLIGFLLRIIVIWYVGGMLYSTVFADPEPAPVARELKTNESGLVMIEPLETEHKHKVSNGVVIP